MKKVLFLINILLVISEVLKAQITDYNSLDTSQPIEFLGSSIRFKGSHLNLLRKYKMGDFCIFVLPQTISYKSPICTKYSAKIQ